jgi:hypothetical protein
MTYYSTKQLLDWNSGRFVVGMNVEGWDGDMSDLSDLGFWPENPSGSYRYLEANFKNARVYRGLKEFWIDFIRMEIVENRQGYLFKSAVSEMLEKYDYGKETFYHLCFLDKDNNIISTLETDKLGMTKKGLWKLYYDLLQQETTTR